MSGMAFANPQGELAGIYLGTMGRQGLFTPGDRIGDFIGSDAAAPISQLVQDIPSLRDQFTEVATHYRYQRQLAQRTILDLSTQAQATLGLHSQVGTGEIDSAHVFRFFEAEQRDAIFKPRFGIGKAKTPEDFSTREAVDLLREHYPAAETLDNLLKRGTFSDDIFFRAQPEIGICLLYTSPSPRDS